MATIKEIAERAGVSTTTVSNVINGKTKRVSLTTIGKIETLLKECNYVPKMGLRVLSNGSSRIIGVVTYASKTFGNAIFADPFYGTTIGVLERCIREAGYFMMLYSSTDVNEIFQMAQAWNVDGIVAVTFSFIDCDKLTKLTNKPVVSIDAWGTPLDTIVNIGLDDIGGGYTMTKYLLGCGYRDIYCIGDSTSVRWYGYQKAFNEYLLPSRQSNFILIHDDRDLRRSDFENLLKFVKRGDALFFFSDYYAIEALSFFADHHINVPDDIAIVGFDDIIYSVSCSPKLTTIHQDIAGKRSWRLKISFACFRANR